MSGDTTGPLTRRLYLVAGWLCVGLGVAGLALPLMPGTVFLILAAACFARSSPRFEAWLVNHPRFGAGVRAWRERGAVPRRAKALAIGGMAVSLVSLIVAGAPGWAVATAVVMLGAAGGFLLTRPDG